MNEILSTLISAGTLLVYGLIISAGLVAAFSGVPWVNTSKKDIGRFLTLADIQPGQKVYDLGCGDGRIVFAAADRGAAAVGLELSLIPFLLAQFKRLLSRDKPRVKFRFKNFWNVNLADADVVYIWLMPSKHEKLQEKLQKELKPGAKVIARCWPIGDWKPAKVDEEKTGQPLFLYVI